MTTPTQPFVFIAHRQRDKPLLVPLIAQLLDDGVRVMIDDVSDFHQFADYVHSDQLMEMTGGGDWDQKLDCIINSDDCACVLAAISFSAVEPDELPVLQVEMQQARDKKKLLCIEIEENAFKEFVRARPYANKDFKLADYRRLYDKETDKFAYHYDRIGQDVADITQNRIQFGDRLISARLAEKQQDAAYALLGSRSTVITKRYDDTDRPFLCRLVPGDGSGIDHFWLTENPVEDWVEEVGQVEQILDETRGFRLPTELELKRALAPSANSNSGRNPFGFATSFSHGVWAQRGNGFIVAGNGEAAGAPVMLVFEG